MSKTHQATILQKKGTALSTTTRQTPTPGAQELLLEVHALALNPVDHYQRDGGFFINEYPAILGSDVAGVVVSTGSATRADGPKPGTRVVALASSFFSPGADYGAFQRFVLVREDFVAVLPGGYSFAEGAVFPLAVGTTWNGWIWAGFSTRTCIGAGAGAGSREGVFVWGASSSIGSLAVQEARLMGFTVYATASRQHHGYIQSLGATRVFDYKDEDVLAKMVRVAGEDGVTIRVGYHAAGDQQLAVNVLDALRGEGKGKLAIAPILDPGLKVPEGVEVAFVYPPQDPEEMRERYRAIFVDWLGGVLAAGQVVASPHIKVIQGGLESVNGALDELKAGVSCSKIVVEL